MLGSGLLADDDNAAQALCLPHFIRLSAHRHKGQYRIWPDNTVLCPEAYGITRRLACIIVA